MINGTGLFIKMVAVDLHQDLAQMYCLFKLTAANGLEDWNEKKFLKTLSEVSTLLQELFEQICLLLTLKC